MRKPGRLTEAQCKEKDMTIKERNVFDAIDMWWKEFGYGPSYDDIMRITGDKGRGNVHRVIDNLVKLGVCKKIKGKDRRISSSMVSSKLKCWLATKGSSSSSSIG